jgi:hypothetical protein
MLGDAYLQAHCRPQCEHPTHRKLDPTIQFLDKTLVSYGIVVSNIYKKQRKLKENRMCVYKNKFTSQTQKRGCVRAHVERASKDSS